MRAPVSPTAPTARNGPLYYRAVSYVERFIEDGPEGDASEPILQKEIALAIGIKETTFSQKKKGILSHFYEDEFDAIAEFLRRRTNRPLIGFPHLEWQMMLACDRKVGGWRG
jgi:hypothetical protein